ncbi:hypothetical protein BC832DRAFT_551816 [Gaertneriomyces semiglobifer]|nr:hypothetical protein BC832DRAFT_551816 [Gaertneriomyces semiglobifer]
MRIMQHLKANPPLVLLVAAVGGGLGAAGFMGSHFLMNDPTVVVRFNRKDVFPWLDVRQDQNLKLYAVNQKFEKKDIPRDF